MTAEIRNGMTARIWDAMRAGIQGGMTEEIQALAVTASTAATLPWL